MRTDRWISSVSRRAVLRGGAVSVALPMLDLFRLRRSAASGAPEAAAPRCIVFVVRPLGYLADNFFPKTEGRDYEPSVYLRHVEAVRDRLTVISGISHPGHGHHTSEIGFLTGAPRERIAQTSCCYGLEGVNNTISIDQYLGGHLASAGTRFSNLALGEEYLRKSFTADGTNVPTIPTPAEAFKTLFVEGTEAERQRELRRLGNGKSILDRVVEDAKTLAVELGAEDKQRVEQLFASIRGAEQSIARLHKAAEAGKPKVDFALPEKMPTTDDVAELSRLWFDIVRMAFATDSTRVVMLSFKERAKPQVGGDVLPVHHDLTHHGGDKKKIEQLTRIEEAEMVELGRFLASLHDVRTPDGTLLDRTVVFHGSNLGDASSHGCQNAPILLAGGGLRHKGHLVYDRKNNKNLSNLFVRLAQHMGVETERFGMSDGVITDV
jgi:hypothetical protein